MPSISTTPLFVTHHTIPDLSTLTLTTSLEGRAEVAVSYTIHEVSLKVAKPLSSVPNHLLPLLSISTQVIKLDGIPELPVS